MPIAETPLEQEVVALATKWTGEVTDELFVGADTFTPELVLAARTVMVTGVFAVPPQWSHDCTVVL